MNPIGRFLDPEMIEKLNHLAISARSVVEGNTVGLHRSPIKGASVEFRQHRSYVPGDEPRRIDWRVLARSDRTYVKEYDEETNLRCTIFLDASGSMGYPVGSSKFAYASRIVSGLAYLMLAQTESCGMAIAQVGSEAWLAPSAASTQIARVIDILERTHSGGENALEKTILRCADRMDRRSLVIILSDFFQPIDLIRNALARLHHDKHEIVIARVLHPDERTFPFKSWFRFTGLEGESSRMVESAMVREKYLKNFKRHEDNLMRACQSIRADLITCESTDPLMESIVKIIRRRG